MAGHAGRQPVGVEYYCFRNDELWQRSDSALVELAIKELAAIGLMSESNVISGQVERLQEACPVHIVGYREITKRLLDNLAELQNLQSVGRNGLFTYNQMSHSVDCGLRAAENVLGANHRIEPPGAGESVVF
jgi:protoporphyrinogen oxidase